MGFESYKGSKCLALVCIQMGSIYAVLIISRGEILPFMSKNRAKNNKKDRFLHRASLFSILHHTFLFYVRWGNWCRLVDEVRTCLKSEILDVYSFPVMASPLK